MRRRGGLLGCSAAGPSPAGRLQGPPCSSPPSPPCSSAPPTTRSKFSIHKPAVGDCNKQVSCCLVCVCVQPVLRKKGSDAESSRQTWQPRKAGCFERAAGTILVHVKLKMAIAQHQQADDRPRMSRKAAYQGWVGHLLHHAAHNIAAVLTTRCPVWGLAWEGLRGGDGSGHFSQEDTQGVDVTGSTARLQASLVLLLVKLQLVGAYALYAGPVI